jgi:hypothetical protein
LVEGLQSADHRQQFQSLASHLRLDVLDRDGLRSVRHSQHEPPAARVGKLAGLGEQRVMR